MKYKSRRLTKKVADKVQRDMLSYTLGVKLSKDYGFRSFRKLFRTMYSLPAWGENTTQRRKKRRSKRFNPAAPFADLSTETYKAYMSKNPPYVYNNYQS